MTRDDLFNALWQMVKDTDLDYQELLDDQARHYLSQTDGEGGVYIRFTNVTTDEE